MRVLGNLSLVIAVVSVAVGIWSRWDVRPVYGIEAHAFLQFAQTMLLLAIALYVHPKTQ